MGRFWPRAAPVLSDMACSIKDRREERAVATFFSPVLVARLGCYAMSAVGVGLAIVENTGLAAPSSTLLYVKPLPMYSLALETR